MLKLIIPIVFAAFLMATSADAQYFGFGGNKKTGTNNTAPSANSPAQPTTVLTPDQFKSKVNTLNQQTQQGLRNQLQQDLGKKVPNTVQNISPPPTQNKSPVPQSPVGTAPITPSTTPIQPVTTTPPMTQAPPASQSMQPAPQPNTVYSAPPPTQGGESGIYTGFQSPQTNQPTNSNAGQTGQQQNWNIKY